MDCSLPGSSARGIFADKNTGVGTPLPPPGDLSDPCVSCIGRWRHWVTRLPSWYHCFLIMASPVLSLLIILGSSLRNQKVIVRLGLKKKKNPFTIKGIMVEAILLPLASHCPVYWKLSLDLHNCRVAWVLVLSTWGNRLQSKGFDQPQHPAVIWWAYFYLNMKFLEELWHQLRLLGLTHLAWFSKSDISSVIHPWNIS